MADTAPYRASSDFLPQQRERMGSMSLGQTPTTENGGGTPANGHGPVSGPPPTSTELPAQVQAVLQSEIGVSTMLNRLKQSISTAREFALFLKKRAELEEHHSNGIRKVSKMTADTMGHSDHMQGSFGHAYKEMMDVHEKMANNGYQFAMSLHQMHEDLLELAAIAEKNRKGWKQNGLAAEQRVADVEAAMRKSKSKYDQLAEDYDRARTGDTSRRGGFGFKGPKSAAQYEEDLLRKVQAADQDYHGKVQTLQAERGELIRTTRPEAIKALQDIVKECDGGIALQVQKFASFNEKLLLSNGLSISPLKNAGKPDPRSLREIVTAINTDNDLHEYLSGYQSKLPPRSGEPKYERHPVLNQPYSQPQSQMQQQGPPQMPHLMTQPMGQPMGQPQMQTPGSMNSRTGPMGSYSDNMAQSPQGPSSMGQGFGGPVPVIPAAQRPASGNQHERSFSHSSAFSQSQSSISQQQQYPIRNSAQPSIPSSRFNSSISSQAPPQLGALSFQSAPQQQQAQQQQQPPPMQAPQGGPNPLMQHPPNGARPGSSGVVQGRNQSPPSMAPSRHVFGVSLERLYQRDGLAVPMIVHQCIQAVNLFGISVEGIYRLSGSVPHVNKLKGMFDTDSRSNELDFRNPENFFHDVNSVAGLLKQFIRDLPEPLLTKEHYSGFIEAARNDDDTVRRDSLHAIINSLPDPNYATLRALTLHLHRIMENSAINRMNSQNLAIVFGPTLMGTGASSNIADAGWQVRVVDTILQNTYQIFDEE